MLGAGLGLLLASRLSSARRRELGSSLLAVGLLSTIPLALRVFKSKPAATSPALPNASDEPVRRGRHHVLPIAIAGTVDAQRM
jgi:hypothetical protein